MYYSKSLIVSALHMYFFCHLLLIITPNFLIINSYNDLSCHFHLLFVIAKRHTTYSNQIKNIDIKINKEKTDKIIKLTLFY